MQVLGSGLSAMADSPLEERRSTAATSLAIRLRPGHAGEGSCTLNLAL
jgi:hypothetical protein